MLKQRNRIHVVKTEVYRKLTSWLACGSMVAVLELVAGSYEQISFGYRVKTDDKVGWSVSFCGVEYYFRRLKLVLFLCLKLTVTGIDGQCYMTTTSM